MSMSRQEERLSVSGMESVFSGSVLDPEMCSRLSLEEKRKLVHEIAQCSKDAPEVLRSFTRRELLQIICSEMGKERKYTGYSKFQMIEHLLKLVSQRPKRSNTDSLTAISLSKFQVQNKRQRNIEAPSQLVNEQELGTNNEENAKFRVCENVACRANLSLEDAFCKRCSCCVCHHYDDNKDPSLWLTCGSDTVGENDSCGMSCHLECALKHERSGISKKNCSTKLDGSFYCVSCGKINDIMRTWKKQLLIAKEARRVDVLCLRLSLCHKILLGTEQYKEVQRIVERAAKMLSKEVGPLDQVCTKMSRGIINRLTCGSEVQKMCSSAVEYFDSMSSYPDPSYKGTKDPTTCEIQFEESSPTSVTIGLRYDDNLLSDVLGSRLWHRKCDTNDYPELPSLTVFKPEKRLKVTNLQPSSEYSFKVSLISSQGVLRVWEAKWVTPALLESCNATLQNQHEKEENMEFVQNHSQAESTNSSDIKLDSKDHPAKLRLLDGINKKTKGSHLLPSLIINSSVSPLTPSKLDIMQRKVPSPSCGKQSEESDYEYSVRVVKWLENGGHIGEDFRVKFLTWFSLKATKQERRVVRVFVDTFVDDPPSLAGQLTHTFLDNICCEQKPISSYGFCKRLRH